MLKCIDCGEEKEAILQNFPYNKSSDRFIRVCKPCGSKRTKVYKSKNSDKWKQYDKKQNIQYKEVVNEWKSQGCSKCNEKRPWVIDAHHKDPETKSFAIGTAMRGINVLKEELNKCIPLCSNCHRDLHHNLENQK
jgi:hypothetical protein